MAAEGFEGLCTTLRAVCSSTVFLLSGQSAFVATVGVYDGASGSSLEDVGSHVLTGVGVGGCRLAPSVACTSHMEVWCLPLHRWHFPDDRQ